VTIFSHHPPGSMKPEKALRPCRNPEPTLRTIGTPRSYANSSLQRLSSSKTLVPLSDPEQLFTAIAAVEGWRSEDPGSYVLSVSDARVCRT